MEVLKISEKTKSSGLVQFIKYCFVGGIATVFDTGLYTAFMWVFDKTAMNVNLATFIAEAIGFVAGLVVNFILSKMFVFTGEAKVKSQKAEFLAYAVIGLVGLLLTYLLLLLFNKFIVIAFLGKWNVVFNKLLATGIVLVYNYLAREFFVYKK